MSIVFIVICVVASHIIAGACKSKRYSIFQAALCGALSGFGFALMSVLIALLTGYSEISYFVGENFYPTLGVFLLVVAAYVVRCVQAVSNLE